MNTFVRFLIVLLATCVLVPVSVGLVVIVHAINTVLMRHQSSIVVGLVLT